MYCNEAQIQEKCESSNCNDLINMVIMKIQSGTVNDEEDVLDVT